MPAKKDTKRASRGGAKKATVSGSVRAGTCYPTGRLNRMLKNARLADRTGGSAGVFLAGVLDYITAEMLGLAGDVCKSHKMKTIAPRHINLGVRGDRLLNKMMASCSIIESPVMPNVNEFLFPGKKGKKGGDVHDASQPL